MSRVHRRSFELLEVRLAASETLLSLAATSLVDPHPINVKNADRSETAYEIPQRETQDMLIAPPQRKATEA